jgi:hypothetical protein
MEGSAVTGKPNLPTPSSSSASSPSPSTRSGSSVRALVVYAVGNLSSGTGLSLSFRFRSLCVSRTTLLPLSLLGFAVVVVVVLRVVMVVGNYEIRGSVSSSTWLPFETPPFSLGFSVSRHSLPSPVWTLPGTRAGGGRCFVIYCGWC